jgi:hypothetical protein
LGVIRAAALMLTKQVSGGFFLDEWLECRV